MLDGSGSSDPDSDPLTYSWSFDSVPTGSTANLSDSDGTLMPTFRQPMWRANTWSSSSSDDG